MASSCPGSTWQVTPFTMVLEALDACSAMKIMCDAQCQQTSPIDSLAACTILSDDTFTATSHHITYCSIITCSVHIQSINRQCTHLIDRSHTSDAEADHVDRLRVLVDGKHLCARETHFSTNNMYGILIYHHLLGSIK